MGTRDLQETEGGGCRRLGAVLLQASASPVRVVSGPGQSRRHLRRSDVEGASRSIWGNLSLRKPPVFPGEAKLRVLAAPWLSALVQDCSPGQCLPEPAPSSSVLRCWQLLDL